MDKKELTEFLKENLTIELDREWETYGDRTLVRVTLRLDQEKISSDTLYITEG